MAPFGSIPIPTEAMLGVVELPATFCFATPTDPQDPLAAAMSTNL
jgi:hypothetical protein